MKRWLIPVSLLLMAVLVLGVLQLNFRITHVQIGEEYYPVDLETLDLSGQTLESPRQYAVLDSLKELDLRGTGISVEDYEYLHSRLPQCHIQWLLPFQGSFLPLDTKQLRLSYLAPEDISLLGYLTQLETVNAIDCQDLDLVLAMMAEYPQLEVSYRVPLCGIRYDHDVTQLSLAAATPAQLAYALPLLPMVETISIHSHVEDPNAMLELVKTYPQIRFRYRFQLQGVSISNSQTQLDLSGVELDSLEEVEAAIAHLPGLTSLEMCGCGIPDEDMAGLKSRYPDINIVWEITLGSIRLRTDLTHFMPYQYRYQVTDKDADKLKYLTELVCLDLGHMDISRTDYLAYMTKLEYLLLGDTLVWDLSPCANLKQLKYLELFLTDVKDYSPLKECPNLEDLNVCYTRPDDPTVLCQLTQVKNLWYRGTMYDALYVQLKEALPNTRLVPVSGNNSSTGYGWRELPNYYAQRDILGMWYMTG